MKTYTAKLGTGNSSFTLYLTKDLLISEITHPDISTCLVVPLHSIRAIFYSKNTQSALHEKYQITITLQHNDNTSNTVLINKIIRGKENLNQVYEIYKKLTKDFIEYQKNVSNISLIH